MAREIISSDYVRKSGIDSDKTEGISVIPPTRDNYFDRLFKYIPAELVAAYIFVLGTVKQITDQGTATTLQWSLFILFVVLTPLYLCRVQKVSKAKQLVISTLSFAVWVFALGGPFAALGWYNPVYGAVVLPVFTLLVAIVEA